MNNDDARMKKEYCGREDAKPWLTLMADWGGAYLWILPPMPQAELTSLVGSCVAGVDDDEFLQKHGASMALIYSLEGWCIRHNRSNPGDENDTFDWHQFSEDGIALAKRLKSEIGADFNVRFDSGPGQVFV